MTRRGIGGRRKRPGTAEAPPAGPGESRSDREGSPPGTLVHVGERKTDTVRISVMLSGMLETYLSSISNRMNEVMKVLTIISTIFIPLTFIAGVYGMNFEHMPELKWRLGYFLILGLMIVVGLIMAAFFKRKKWF